jgi:hypothetical protein
MIRTFWKDLYRASVAATLSVAFASHSVQAGRVTSYVVFGEKASSDEQPNMSQREAFYNACEPSCYKSQTPSQETSKFKVDSSAWHNLCSCICTGGAMQLDSIQYKLWSDTMAVKKDEFMASFFEREPMFKVILQNCVDSIVNY